MTGVYYLWDGAECIYVGASTNVEKRVCDHRRNGIDFAGYFLDQCKKSELNAKEAQAIQSHRPKLNSNSVLRS